MTGTTSSHDHDAGGDPGNPGTVMKMGDIVEPPVITIRVEAERRPDARRSCGSESRRSLYPKQWRNA